MFVLVTIAYTAPIETVLQHTPDHRAYLAKLNEAGKLLASGPFVPRTGGLLLLRVEDEGEVTAILDADPFKQRGVASYETRVWAPTIGADKLAAM
jgi:uncharacterized protein YciI